MPLFRHDHLTVPVADLPPKDLRGDRLTVRIPALDVTTEAEIILINVQGQFASWRATRATGDFDLRSFELRARPVQPLKDLRPGMSAVIQLDR